MEDHEIYKVAGRTEPRRETRLPFASQRYRAPTKEEFRTVIQTLGLTGSIAGRLLGVDGRTIRKWIGGEREIPYSAWRLLLINAGLALEDPDELSGDRDVDARKVADKD